LKHRLWEREFARLIEAFFGGGSVSLLSKGRVALYAGLRAMSLPAGSKVLLPGYTCMVVPSAVQYAGLEPLYVDVDPSHYNLDPALLAQVPAQNVAAVIVQHTYGIPCDMAPILAWAAARQIPVIEDCCHAFGSRAAGGLCGTLGAFAFMSGQWNKPFSTGLGGILLVNDAALAGRVGRLIAGEFAAPGWMRNLFLQAQILAYGLVVRPHTAGRITRLYRFLTRWGLAIGSSSQAELAGIMPENYCLTMARCQVRKGLREIARIEENQRHRRLVSALYQRRLAEIGFAPLSIPPSIAGEDAIPLLRYPVRVANKPEVLRKAEREGVEIGSWFEVPLHPAGTRMEDFGYRDGACPQAEAACREVVNLPTHRGITNRRAERTLQFLKRVAVPAAL